jgi:tetratricopeptide (TPR) repeat protein
MMLRNITKIFVRFGSVALIAAMVQVSLISPTSAQTTSAQTAGEAQTLVEKIEELKNSGWYAEAIPLQQRHLAITEMALGPNHPDVVQSLNNLGRLYGRQGRYADAESLYKRALAIREKAVGPNHPDVATVLDNLAELYGGSRPLC